MTGSVVAPPTVCMERDFFRMFWLLPRVQKQIAKLTADDRAKVIDALSGPVAAFRCEPVENRQRRGVFKFSVGRDIRVCFRMEERWGVVVFIGEHYKCQRFIDRRAGSVYGRLIPIADFIMSMKNNADDNKPVTSPEASPSTAPAEPSPNGIDPAPDHPEEMSPSFPEWMKMLPKVIDTTFGRKVREAEDACVALMEGVTLRVKAVEAETTQATSSVDVLSQRVDSHVQKTSGDIATLTTAIGETNQRVESVHQQSQTSMAALRNDLSAFTVKLRRHATETTEQFELVVSDLRELREKQETLDGSLVFFGDRFHDFEKTSLASIAEIRDQLGLVQGRDQAAPLVPQIARHDERLNTQDQAVQAALADIARCLKNVAQLAADMGQFKEIVFTLTTGMSELGVTVNALSDRVDSLARQQSHRDVQTIAARLSRCLERIQAGFRSTWVRI